MRRFWPLIPIAAGFLVVVAGFVYDVEFAGIPYQDPTPEMSARYAYHAHIASMICRIGFWILLFGIIAGIIRFIIRRLRPPTSL
jgi:hypothetical protein